MELPGTTAVIQCHKFVEYSLTVGNFLDVAYIYNMGGLKETCNFCNKNNCNWHASHGEI